VTKQAAFRKFWNSIEQQWKNAAAVFWLNDYGGNYLQTAVWNLGFADVRTAQRRI